MRFSGRTEQAKASLHRRADADVLRGQRRWLGAMYLLGYSVECSLKVRLMERHQCQNLDSLAARLSRLIGHDIDLHSHSLDVLMEHTGTKHRVGQNHQLNRAWGVVRNWTVDWRFDPRDGSEGECKRFFDAVDAVRRFIERSV